MKYLTEDLRKEMKPFFYSEYNNSYSALINAGSYRNDIFDEYYEKKGIEGGGYSWDALAALYIEENMKQYQDDLKHDSEADMFCLYSDNEKAIYDFLTGFRAYCEDESKFRDLMERAEFGKWD